jgi:hypothetical protein
MRRRPGISLSIFLHFRSTSDKVAGIESWGPKSAPDQAEK